MTKVSKIEFDFDFETCHDVWAAPLWITPEDWHAPGGTSGEIDFLEMCPAGSFATNFGAPGQPGEYQKQWGSAWGPGGPKHYVMTFDNGGSVATHMCNLDGSGCRYDGASYQNFINRITSKYNHHFVSDVWNGWGGDSGWKGCGGRNSPATSCRFAIMNLKVSTRDGRPLYSGKCAALNAEQSVSNSTMVV